MKQRNLIFLFLFLSCHFAQAQTIAIPNDYSTIQGGINAAQSGDTILVSPGTYAENIDYGGKDLVIGSLLLTTGDTSYISQTIIDGMQNGSVVTFENSESSAAVLTGFTITNGSGVFITNQSFGGGIYVDGASPSLSYLYVQGNSMTTGRGGGIYAFNSDLVMNKLTIKGNSAWNGGGVFLGNDFNGNLNANPKPTLKNSIVSGNSGTIRAGGIYCSYALVRLQRIEVTGNTSDNGGGLYLGNCKALMSHQTIANNTASTNGGVIYLDGAEAVIANSILRDNSPQTLYLYPDPGFSTVTMAYSNVQDTQATINSFDGVMNWEAGNIDVDPLFVAADDYHLQAGSPCKDVAVPLYVWQTDTVINLIPIEYNGPAPDMGAYEEGIVLNTTESLGNHLTDLSLRTYPNPFSDHLEIQYSLAHDAEVSFGLFDLSGKQILGLSPSFQFSGIHQESLQVEDLPAGVYLLKVQTGDGRVGQELVVKGR